MPNDINEQMQAMFRQQHALFKQWIEQNDASSSKHEFFAQDQARAAAIMTTHATEFLQLGTALLAQLKSTTEKTDLVTLLDLFCDQVQQKTGEALLSQWRVPEHLIDLFKTHSFQDDLFLENPVLKSVKALFNFPPAGAVHQYQENLQDGANYLSEYQAALTEYIDHYSQINLEANSGLLYELTEGENTIDTLKGLHDLWVECYEKVYIKTLHTPSYQKSHARISNAVMRLRKYSYDIRDIYFEAAGLATRKGLDTALERQHVLRKQMRHVDRRLAAQEEDFNLPLFEQLHRTVISLSDEIDHLRSELTTLKQSSYVSSNNKGTMREKPEA